MYFKRVVLDLYLLLLKEYLCRLLILYILITGLYIFRFQTDFNFARHAKMNLSFLPQSRLSTD